MYIYKSCLLSDKKKKIQLLKFLIVKCNMCELEYVYKRD